MEETITLSGDARTTSGILLLTIVAVEYGGVFMLKVVRGGASMTSFQQSFARAGHAHAGVLVILALVCQLLADAAGISGFQASLARSGVPVAAILVSAGFFLSSAGKARTQPNRLIVMVWLGAVSLAAGVIALGLGLIRS